MVDCPNGRKIIEWRYSHNKSTRIIGADRYTRQEMQKPLPDNGFVYFKISIQWEYNGSDPSRNYEQNTDVIDAYFGAHKTGRMYRGVPFWEDVNHDRGNLYVPFGTRTENGNNATGAYRFRSTESYTATSWSFSSICNVPDAYQRGCENGNLPETECEFKVYLGGQLILAQKNDECPEVEEYCENECPANTCECQCGSVVCCRDSVTGEVVKQFRKTK